MLRGASETVAEHGYQTTNRITGRARWWALGAVLLTMFFSAMDQTVVSTALPTIIGDLKGLSSYTWVFTAYMMTSAITVPIYGKLSDMYGRKPFYVGGLALFMLGSAMSGMAHSMSQLIAARAFQGLGAGAMMSMPRATISDIFNPRELGKWQGLIASTFGVASIIGPTLGGWITDNWSWRWIFYINLPVAAIALVAVWLTLPQVRTEQRARVDWTGTVLLVAGLVPMLLAFSWAGGEYAWGSPMIIGLLAVSLVLLTLFALVELRVVEPVVPPALFRNPIFTSTTIVGLFMSMGMFGSLMFLPMYVQGVLGISATNSGLILTPMMLSFMVGSVFGGYMISRTGRYKVQAVLGGTLGVVGTYLLTRMGVSTSYGTVVRNMIITGLGIGSVMPLLGVVVQNALPYKMMGVAKSAQQFVRSLGGVIAAPILGTVLANTFANRLPALLPEQLKEMLVRLPADQRQAFMDPQGLVSAQTQEAIKAKFTAFGPAGMQLYHEFLAAVRHALSLGVGKLFTVGLWFAAAALVATFFIKEIPLAHDEFYGDETVPADSEEAD